ncbi:MAG: WD40 repeat domain-containing protein [Methanomicrobiaceae archaeon]|nr:WD40 repeat domain-containing protein [Methanomicrobiaceae archaeon]
MGKSPGSRVLFLACVALALLVVLPVTVSASYSLWVYRSEADISGVTVTPDGSAVLVCGDRIHVLNPDGSVRWKKWFGDHISTSADGTTVICTFGSQIYRYSGDGTLCWDIALDAKPRGVVVTPDGSRTIVGDTLGTVSVIDETGEITREYVTDTRTEILDVAISGDGNTIGVISTAGTWCFSKYGSLRWRKDERMEGDGGQCLALSHNGGKIVAGCEDMLRFLDNRGKVVWKYDCARRITAVAISGNGEYVTAATQGNMLLFFTADGTLQWDFDLGKSSPGGEYTGPGIRDLNPDRTEDGWVQDIAMSEDGEWILTGSTNKLVRLFCRDGTLVRSERADNPVTSIALTEDGSFGIAGTNSQVIALIREPDPEPISPPVPPDVASPVIPVVPAPRPEDPDMITQPVAVEPPVPLQEEDILRNYLSEPGAAHDILRMFPALMNSPFR